MDKYRISIELSHKNVFTYSSFDEYYICFGNITFCFRNFAVMRILILDV